jgi:hypothetical protein
LVHKEKIRVRQRKEGRKEGRKEKDNAEAQSKTKKTKGRDTESAEKRRPTFSKGRWATRRDAKSKSFRRG